MDSFLPYCKFDFFFLEPRISVIFIFIFNFSTNENCKLIKLLSWGPDEHNLSFLNSSYSISQDSGIMHPLYHYIKLRCTSLARQNEESGGPTKVYKWGWGRGEGRGQRSSNNYFYMGLIKNTICETHSYYLTLSWSHNKKSCRGKNDHILIKLEM